MRENKFGDPVYKKFNNQYALYLTLKSWNTEGLIRRGELMQACSINGKSNAINSRYAKDLIKYGFIIELKNYGHALVSYDKILKRFGYQTKKRVRTKGVTRDKKFVKVVKIKASQEICKNLPLVISRIDAEIVSGRMNHKANKIERRRKGPSYIVQSLFETQLSHQYLAELWGFKTRQAARRRIIKMESVGLLNVIRNKSVTVATGVKKRNFSGNGKQFWFKGRVMEYQCNSFFFPNMYQ